MADHEDQVSEDVNESTHRTKHDRLELDNDCAILHWNREPNTDSHVQQSSLSETPPRRTHASSPLCLSTADGRLETLALGKRHAD